MQCKKTHTRRHILARRVPCHCDVQTVCLHFRKINKIVATRYQILRLKCTKFDFVVCPGFDFVFLGAGGWEEPCLQDDPFSVEWGTLHPSPYPSVGGVTHVSSPVHVIAVVCISCVWPILRSCAGQRTPRLIEAAFRQRTSV